LSLSLALKGVPNRPDGNFAVCRTSHPNPITFYNRAYQMP